MEINTRKCTPRAVDLSLMSPLEATGEKTLVKGDLSYPCRGTGEHKMGRAHQGPCPPSPANTDNCIINPLEGAYHLKTIMFVCSCASPGEHFQNILLLQGGIMELQQGPEEGHLSACYPNVLD